MEGGIDHRTTTSLAGLYLHTLEAIFLTSSSASGGSHRLLFETSNAASISSNPIPHRRIVPPAVPLAAGVNRGRDDYRSALALDVQSRPNLSRGVLPQDYHMGLPR